MATYYGSEDERLHINMQVGSGNISLEKGCVELSKWLRARERRLLGDLAKGCRNQRVLAKLASIRAHIV
jgi:hypothetical protein